MGPFDMKYDKNSWEKFLEDWDVSTQYLDISFLD